MTILVTGGSGTVGRAMSRLTDRFSAPLRPTSRAQLDITEADALDLTGVTVVVNLAAATDVDRCEREPRWAEAVNRDGAENVARAARGAGARLVHVSTTAVFGGDDAPGPFAEGDPTHPPNVYARTKLQGEEAVLAAHPEALIVRTAWVFGGGAEDPKFVGKVAGRLRAGEPVSAVNDQWGSPTYAHDLVVGLAALLARRATGIVHLTNAGRATRHDMATHMKQVLGSSSEVRAVGAATFPLPARRSTDDSAISTRLHQLGVTMPTWQDALTRYLG